MRAGVGGGMAALGREFARWRDKHGGRGRRIPAALWAEAVELARREGVQSTARALRLDVERLRARVGKRSAAPAGGPVSPAFVEVPAGALGGGQTVVELVGRGGERMRIHIASPGSEELLGLVQAFWSRQA